MPACCACKSGREERIRTSDPSVPNAVLYQTEPLPDLGAWLTMCRLGAGKRVMTTSSSPGVALMQEGIAYMAGAEIPGVIVNVQRGGPGLGTIQPSQSDYFQATRGGGNGDYNTIVLAPASVQEMADFVDLAFTLAFRYRNPAMILSDGVIGQMMEKVILPPSKPRRSEEQIRKECPWATIGRTADRKPISLLPWN